MARRPYTRELYEALLAGFRESPGNANYAARHAQCERRMALRAWETGWPSIEWARPIQEVLARERDEVRAQILEREEAARTADAEAQASTAEKSRKQAIETRVQIGQALMGSRGTLLGAIAGAATLIPAVQLIAAHADKVLAAMITEQKAEIAKGPAGDAKKLIAPEKLLLLLDRYARVSQRLTRSVHDMIQAERLNLGLPTVIVGEGDGTMTLEEAVAELKAGQTALERAKAKGIGVVDGGAGKVGAPPAPRAPAVDATAAAAPAIGSFPRAPVQSTSLRSIGHDAQAAALEVEFLDGSVFRYEGVRVEIFASRTRWPSVGKWFAQEIRAQPGLYPARRLGPAKEATTP